jgi:hypothetical protein
MNKNIARCNIVIVIPFYFNIVNYFNSLMFCNIYNLVLIIILGL